MKPEKATEFYSAHYEGSLEQGIKVQFEALMASNPSVAADYAEFVASMEDLGVFAQTEVPIPDDLHEQISRRLDRHIFENKQTVKGSWLERFRLHLVGGVAAVTLIGSVFFMNQSGKSFSGGISGGEANVIEVKMQGGEAVLNYTPNKSDTVSITRAPSGETFKELKVQAGQVVETPLTNSGTSAETLRIETEQGAEALYVAIPGSKRSTSAEGMGNLVKLASAMADFYHQPVQLTVRDRDRSVRWTLAPGSATDSKLEGVQLSVSTKNGLIRLGD